MNENKQESEHGPLMVFDGVCVLCTAWLRFIVKHDRHREFKFATIQSPVGHQLLLNNGLDPDDPESFLLLVNGQAHSASGAVIRIVSGFGGGWRLIKALYIVPRPIRDWIYRLVARNRYDWFGKRDSCMVPDRQLRSRFIDDNSAGGGPMHQ